MRKRPPRLSFSTMHLLEYFDRALRDATLDPARRTAVAREGLRAVEARLKDTPDDAQALAVKGLLLRVLARLETDATMRSLLLHEADAAREGAIRARKKHLAGL
jgi:hypothetical protein